MIHQFTLFPGITLRCVPDDRFKQACMTVQLVHPMNKEEAPLNALVPAVLLRGTESAPDIRSITQRLDDLYGASVGVCIRRVGDYQTTGFGCGFVEDRLALSGDRILEPMVQFLKELLLCPVLENGIFRQDYVETEKKNLTDYLQSQYNDKIRYANLQLLRYMCKADSYGVPRLGEAEDVQKVTAQALYDYYRRILRECPIEIFYVGSACPETVAALVKEVFRDVERDCVSLPGQTPFCDGGEGRYEEKSEAAQSRLCMGFTAPVDGQAPKMLALQMMGYIFGGGMTSKLFMNVREKMSLCYDIGASYYSSKGLLLVSAGVDRDKVEITGDEILNQLESCRNGDISQEELNAAKESVCSHMRTVTDSAGAIEEFYSIENLSGCPMTPEAYIQQIEKITIDDVVAAAKTLKLHTVYTLEGVSQ
jgi:predicted Zn-dependent peptidase